MLKPNAITIYNYVKENEGSNITLSDIAEGTGLDKKVVNGVIVANFQRKGLMIREVKTVEVEGAAVEVKFIKLTDEGRAFDPTATEEAKA